MKVNVRWNSNNGKFYKQENVYKTVDRATMMYVTECWALNKNNKKKILVAEIK